MISTISTVWCNGTDGYGGEHAEGCPVWNGEGRDAKAARADSAFTQRPGGRDYSRACLAVVDAAPASDTPTP